MKKATMALAAALLLAGCPEPEQPPALDRPEMLVDTLPDTPRAEPGDTASLTPGPDRAQPGIDEADPDS